MRYQQWTLYSSTCSKCDGSAKTQIVGTEIAFHGSNSFNSHKTMNFILLILIPIAIGLWAQMKVKSAYGKYVQVPSRGRITGREAVNLTRETPTTKTSTSSRYLKQHTGVSK